VAMGHLADPVDGSYIQRHFMWFQLASFVTRRDISQRPDDCLDADCTHVVLSADDCLVPARTIERYLASGDVPTTVFEDAQHAGFLMVSSRMNQVIEIVSGMVERVKREREDDQGKGSAVVATTTTTPRPSTRMRRRHSSVSKPLVAAFPMPPTRSLYSADVRPGQAGDGRCLRVDRGLSGQSRPADE
jgi:hypothetical protein